MGASIRDELSPVEAAQAVDRAEPEEPAGVPHDAADTSVRKAVFNRVDTNRQPLSVDRGHRDQEQPRKRPRAATLAALTDQWENESAAS
jgi:hypothetical protein